MHVGLGFLTGQPEARVDKPLLVKAGPHARCLEQRALLAID